MGKKYSRAETIAQIKEAVKDMSSLYRAPCVNHAGTTYKADGNEYYTEIVSEYLLKNDHLLDQIAQINRGDYSVDTHNGTTPRAASNRLEERIALSLFQTYIFPIGRIIDYQIPLKRTQKDNAGKIDLISFDEVNGILRLIELKAPQSHDTLLHCVLEIYTYYKMANIPNLIASYGLSGKCKEVRICALFFKDSTQNKEYEEYTNTLFEHENLFDLMRKIRHDKVKVELLRFPYKIVYTVPPVPQNNPNVHGMPTPSASSGDKGQGVKTSAPGSNTTFPEKEHPYGFPPAPEKISDHVQGTANPCASSSCGFPPSSEQTFDHEPSESRPLEVEDLDF